MADPVRLSRGLEAAAQAGIRYVCLTGGEPLLYPDLLFCLTRARALGLTTLLCTNGSLLTAGLIEALGQPASRPSSFPSTRPPRRPMTATGACRADRPYPGHAPPGHAAGLNPVASVTLSRLIDDLDEMVRLSGGWASGTHLFIPHHPAALLLSGLCRELSGDLFPGELYGLFTQVQELKERSPVNILNPRLGLEESQRQLQGLPCRFPCLAGYKYLFVDWHLKVYRCHFRAETLGPLEEIDRLTPIRDGCNACTIDCYRDPSVYQYLAVSVADTLAAWSRGEVVRGLKTLLNPVNVLSLSALLEGRHWVQ